jgi:hypothetical protein
MSRYMGPTEASTRPRVFSGWRLVSILTWIAIIALGVWGMFQ